MDPRGRQVLDALGEAPAGAELLAAASGLEGVHLVGGAVRDLLLGRIPRELDVVVEGDPARLIERLAGSGSAPGGGVTKGGEAGGAAQPGGSGPEPDAAAAQAARRHSAAAAVHHPRFATATVHTKGGRVDVARARRERYPAGGALPEVEPAALEEDLRRRDFTVNAIAVALDDGELKAPPEALADLSARRLRVLHDQSFVEDPTRLLRLARYQARLGFDVEPHTAALAADASLESVSGARIGAELRLALLEPDPLAVLAGLPDLPVAVDRQLTGRASRLLPSDGRLDLMILGAVTRGVASTAWLESLEFTARERDTILAVWGAGALAAAMASAERASGLRATLAAAPVEAVALAGALGPQETARRWLDELRHVGLEIAGGDLLAAGLEPGPEIGRRLERTLDRKLDGELPGGRQAELADALG